MPPAPSQHDRHAAQPLSWAKRTPTTRDAATRAHVGRVASAARCVALAVALAAHSAPAPPQHRRPRALHAAAGHVIAGRTNRRRGW
eukprot:1159958-Prymnesium_polylepis.1